MSKRIAIIVDSDPADLFTLIPLVRSLSKQKIMEVNLLVCSELLKTAAEKLLMPNADAKSKSWSNVKIMILAAKKKRRSGYPHMTTSIVQSLVRKYSDFFYSVDAFVLPLHRANDWYEHVVGLNSMMGEKRAVHWVGVKLGCGAFNEKQLQGSDRCELLLLPNQQDQERVKRAYDADGFVAPEIQVIGNLRLELFELGEQPKPTYFASQKPTILFNPAYICSKLDNATLWWKQWGLPLMNYFKEQEKYNVIIAPDLYCDVRAKFLDLATNKLFIDVPHLYFDKTVEAELMPPLYNNLYAMNSDIYLTDRGRMCFEALIKPKPAIFLDYAQRKGKKKVAGESEFEDSGARSLGAVVNSVEKLVEVLSDHAKWSSPFIKKQAETARLNAVRATKSYADSAAECISLVFKRKF